MGNGRRTEEATWARNDGQEAEAAVETAECDDSHVEISALQNASPS